MQNFIDSLALFDLQRYLTFACRNEVFINHQMICSDRDATLMTTNQRSDVNKGTTTTTSLFKYF